MNWNILLLPQERTRTAFRSNFVNRSIKPSIITKKTDIRLNGSPFVAVPSFGNLPIKLDLNQLTARSGLPKRAKNNVFEVKENECRI